MKVFRVEHSYSNDGPYLGSNEVYHDSSMYENHQKDTHPGFRTEEWEEYASRNLQLDNTVCGFSSMDQCYEWFKGYMALLDRTGFVIKQFSVPRKYTIKGSKQTTFMREHAKLVKTFKCIEKN